MNGITAGVLVLMYIIVFLIGRMVGIIEAKETILKILQEWENNNKESKCIRYDED